MNEFMNNEVSPAAEPTLEELKSALAKVTLDLADCRERAERRNLIDENTRQAIESVREALAVEFEAIDDEDVSEDETPVFTITTVNRLLSAVGSYPFEIERTYLVSASVTVECYVRVEATSEDDANDKATDVFESLDFSHAFYNSEAEWDYTMSVDISSIEVED